MMAAEIERARAALHCIPADLPRDEWVSVLMAGQSAGLDADELRTWSEQGSSYNARDFADTLRSIKPGKGVNAGTLFYEAAAYGWRDGDKPQQRSPSKAAVRPPEPSRKSRPGMAPADVLARCASATERHPYIVKKGAAGVPLDSLRVLPADDALHVAGQAMAGALVVPAYAATGELQSLQLIPVSGKKMNLPGCAMAGASFTVGTPQADAPLYLCEGIGQAWACWQATGHAAICCFGWGNVGTVARAIHERDNAARLVLVPDTGKEDAADKIACELGCMVACLPDGEPPNFDCNDLAQRDGYDVLRELLENASEPPKPDEPEPHPLARIVEPCTELQAPRWLLPGFMAEGLTLIAGGHGVGKTTALLPLACGVAGIHKHGWPLEPKHWRQVVYVTEDISQAQRILAGLAWHLRTTAAAIGERVHLVDARRLDAAYLVQAGFPYRERYSRTVEGVELLPLVVLDTQAATIALENENDNSEASAAIAELKQHFEGLPVWLVAHLAKTNLNRSDVQTLSARGASAWEADANCTAFLVKEGDGPNATRWLVLGKRRFEPRWPELQLESHFQETTGLDAWGESEPLMLRWAMASPSDGTREEVAAKAKEAQALQEDADLRQEIRNAVQIAWQEGHPLNREGVKAKVRRNRAEVVSCIERLLSENWLIEINVPSKLRTHPKKSDFLVNLDTEERDAVRRGEPVPEAKAAIPASWKRAISSVPAESGDDAVEPAERQHEQQISSVPVSSVPYRNKTRNGWMGDEFPPSHPSVPDEARTLRNGWERLGTVGQQVTTPSLEHMGTAPCPTVRLAVARDALEKATKKTAPAKRKPPEPVTATANEDGVTRIRDGDDLSAWND